MGGRGAGGGCGGDTSRHGFSDIQLQRKYDKHSKEFGNISQKEYSDRAIKFRDTKADDKVEQFTTSAGNTFK